MDKPIHIGVELTVRISITFQDAPEIHTLLAMTPVRERGKLIRTALARYVEETDHPAGKVEMQIAAMTSWLRSRNDSLGKSTSSRPEFVVPTTHSQRDPTMMINTLHEDSPHHGPVLPTAAEGYDFKKEQTPATSRSFDRWLL